ncbi:MAG: SdpI family protein [Armatimonadota bacterium]
MRTWTSLALSLAAALGALAYGLAIYGALPELIPTHWNLQGEVDGWMPKSLAVWLSPALAIGFTLLMQGLRAVSPVRYRVEPFLPTFNYVVLLVAGLLASLHVVSLQAALHPDLESGRVVVGGLLLFFGLLSNVLGKVRRNFWVGFRTPWTLASDRVWVATHRLAARLGVVVGIVGVLMLWLGAPVPLAFVLVVAWVVVPVVYSLVVYRQWGGDGQAA